jgi:type IV pilus assembly protein PilQ
MTPLRLAAVLLALAAAPPAQQVAKGAPQQAAPPQAAPPAAAQAAPADGRPAPVLGAGAGSTVKAFAFTAPDRFEFHARGLSVADVFSELRRLVRRNIVVAPDVSASFTGDLYDVSTDEVIATVCRSAGLVTRGEGSFLYVEQDKPETRIYTLKHARADDLLPLIRPLLSPQGQVSGTPAARQGIPSSQEDAGGDEYAAEEMLVVHDVASRLLEVDKVIASTDALPRQVLIEATIMAVELNDDLQYGVELSGIAGLNWGSAGATSDDGQSINVGPFGPGVLNDGLGNLDTNVNQGISKGGLNVGIIKGSIAAFIRALQTVTDTTVLANPRVVTMNKQRGEVLLGRRDGFLTTTVTQTSSTQKVEYLETGTRLVFRPYISGDDMVRLEVHPEDSNGGLTSQGLPFKQTAEVTTNVLLRSGQTVVIGGLFRETEGNTENKVPLLGDIPLVGALFRSTDKSKKREEIVIVLTPTIIDGSQAADWNKAGLRADALHDQVDRIPHPTEDALGSDVAEGPQPPDAAAVARAWFGVADQLLRNAENERAAVLLAGLPQRDLPDEVARHLQSALARRPELLDLDRRILQGHGLTPTAGGVRPTTIDDLARAGWLDPESHP